MQCPGPKQGAIWERRAPQGQHGQVVTFGPAGAGSWSLWGQPDPSPGTASRQLPGGPSGTVHFPAEEVAPCISSLLGRDLPSLLGTTLGLRHLVLPQSLTQRHSFPSQGRAGVQAEALPRPERPVHWVGAP